VQKIISKLIDENLKLMDDKFCDSPDIKRQRLVLKDRTAVLLVYLEGLVDIDLLQTDILQVLLQQTSDTIFGENLQTVHFPATNSIVTDDLDKSISYILSGWPAIFINGYDTAIFINLAKPEKRPICPPTMEKNIKCPQEAFVESLSTNISILRRKIRNNKLKFNQLTIGDLSNQMVVIAYIDGVTNP
jgi:spore germination protein